MTVRDYAAYLLATFDHNLPVVKAINEKDITDDMEGREVLVVTFPDGSIRTGSKQDVGTFPIKPAVLV